MLGLQIAAARTPFTEGTGGLYISEGGDSDKVFLITARHVVFPPNVVPDDDYPRTDTQRHKVLLLGSKAFENFFRSIKVAIGGRAIDIEIYERQLAGLMKKEMGLLDWVLVPNVTLRTTLLSSLIAPRLIRAPLGAT